MQFRRTPLPGVVYNTTMSRPDAALALSFLYGLQGKREARVASIAISGNSLGAAMFADAVFRFYQLGPIPNANTTLPVGLAAGGTLPPDSPMVKAALERIGENGEPLYKRGIRRLSDTAEVTALMRNSLAYVDDGLVSVVLSAPATQMARILDYAGTRELIAAKVRSTIICECPQDSAAMRKLLPDWPAPLVFCGRDTGEALRFPASSIEQDFSWTKAHPVVDFYRAFHPMPYDAPGQDLAAMHFAIRPNAGMFTIATGTIEVDDAGRMAFSESPQGKHKRISVDPEKRDALLASIKEIVTAKPVPPPARRRFTPEEIEKLRREREEEQRKREQQERKAAAKPTP
jgi:hypothetical protein